MPRLALHQSHINPALAQPFQTFRRNAFIDNNHINALRIDDLMQTRTIKFGGIGDDDNAFRHFTHPPVQAGFIFIVGTHTAIEVDGVDAEKKHIEVVIQ